MRALLLFALLLLTSVHAFRRRYTHHLQGSF